MTVTSANLPQSPYKPRMAELRHAVQARGGYNVARSFQLEQVIQSPVLSGVGSMAEVESILKQLQQQQEAAPQAVGRSQKTDKALSRQTLSPIDQNSNLANDRYEARDIATESVDSVQSEVLKKEEPVKPADKTRKQKGTLKILNDQTGDPLIDGLTGRVNNTLTETIYSAVDIPKTMLKWGVGGFALGELIQVGRSFVQRSKTGHWVKQVTKKGTQLSTFAKRSRLVWRFTGLPILLGTLFAIGGGLLAATKAAANLTGAALLNPTKR